MKKKSCLQQKSFVPAAPAGQPQLLWYQKVMEENIGNRLQSSQQGNQKIHMAHARSRGHHF